MIDKQALQELSKLLAELVTGSTITNLFRLNNWKDYYTETGDKMLSTKWKRIYGTINYEIDKLNSIAPVIKIIEDIMKPFNFRNEIEIWEDNVKEINLIIGFFGLELLQSGKITRIKPVSTIQEAVQRTNSLFEKLEEYKVHIEVVKYCKPELLEENYFHAVLEASKSILQRIRNLNFSTKDGNTLINESFNIKNPSIIINGNYFKNDTEKSQYQGLKSLLNTICYLYRNPAAHSPKMYNPGNESDAVQALLLISMAHKQLDNCTCIKYLN